jgi:hypothetical protein
LTSSILAKTTATVLRRPARWRAEIQNETETRAIGQKLPKGLTGPGIAWRQPIELGTIYRLGTGFRGVVTDWQQETGNRQDRHHRAATTPPCRRVKRNFDSAAAGALSYRRLQRAGKTPYESA